MLAPEVRRVRRVLLQQARRTAARRQGEQQEPMAQAPAEPTPAQDDLTTYRLPSGEIVL